MSQGLADEFVARGPWITRFWVDGKSFGGAYDPSTDVRLAEFRRRFRRPARVLDLGCLEGGFSIELAKSAAEVIGIDARTENLDRARWIAERLGVGNVSFLQADLERFDFAGLGEFDVAFNVGLLYHLQEPWNLLTRLAERTKDMFLWTHIAPAGANLLEQGGYHGVKYVELGRHDVLSGMQPNSFWPTLPELRRMVRDAGFASLKVLKEDVKHPHGPAVLLTASTRIPPRHSFGWRSLTQSLKPLAALGSRK